jgi:hypothetical protein
MSFNDLMSGWALQSEVQLGLSKSKKLEKKRTVSLLVLLTKNSEFFITLD